MDARFCYLILRQRNGGNAMAFGERLQEVRKRSGLTQEEFAEQLQVSRQSVSRWESGRGTLRWRRSSSSATATV